MLIFIIKNGINKVISISKIKNNKQIEKYRIENIFCGIFIMLNPDSKGLEMFEVFEFWGLRISKIKIKVKLKVIELIKNRNIFIYFPHQ